METTTLYRGLGELEKARVRASGWREFPARLPDQGIFYAMGVREHAVEITREWSERDGEAGYVVRFAVESAYLAQFPVDDPQQAEYWIPEEKIAEFNGRIVGLIEVVEEFRGIPTR